MTIHAQTLTNPGAESGTTGWTTRSGVTIQSVTGNSHSGTKSFRPDNSFSDASKFDQEVTVDGSLFAAIDADTAALKATAWIDGGDQDTARIYVECYDTSHVLLDSSAGTYIDPTSYTLQEILFRIPVNTRYIRIGGEFDKNVGTVFNNNIDDFTLEISDDHSTDYVGYFDPKAYQVGAYAIGIAPAEQIRTYQLPVAILGSAETSNTFHEVNSYQLGAYALVRGKTDRRDLRAWPFTQDDHDFYVLQLGDVGTLVYDKLTNQWAQWRSPGFDYWRGNDGVQWEGWNICCDSESGILWIIDPEGRLDNDTTPITSIISGRVQTRMRKNAQCHMGELTVSEQEPPTGIDASTISISLRTSDDDGHTFLSHGSVTGEALGDDITVRWYGLGLMPAPGRVFEITDTGYARRIDGFNIEVGDDSVG
jgi:hypothetical protein